MKRAGIYKASNVTFNPSRIEAFSYGWWKFVGVVEGKVVFNNYYYSPSTCKHQSKVRRLLAELGIKIDIEMPVPKGLPGSYHRYGDSSQSDLTLQELIEQAETHLCDKYLEQIEKRQEQYQRAKARKLKAKLEEYLENDCAFRDYEITDRKYFGNPGYMISAKAAVHRVVDSETLENDVQDALNSFHRNGFGTVIFYV